MLFVPAQSNNGFLINLARASAINLWSLASNDEIGDHFLVQVNFGKPANGIWNDDECYYLEGFGAAKARKVMEAYGISSYAGNLELPPEVLEFNPKWIKGTCRTSGAHAICATDDGDSYLLTDLNREHLKLKVGDRIRGWAFHWSEDLVEVIDDNVVGYIHPGYCEKI